MDFSQLTINSYARNLNELASSGKLDPVIGRDEEIRRVLQILSRRTSMIGMANFCLSLSLKNTDSMDAPPQMKARHASPLPETKSELQMQEMIPEKAIS